MKQAALASGAAPAKDPLKTRFTVMMIGCLIIAGTLVSRAAWIQIGRDERLEKLARRQFSTKMLIRPRRGTILDRNGEPIAINTETRSLAMNPLKVQNKRTVARLLSKALDLPYERVLKRVQDKKSFAWIKRHLTDSEFERLSKFKIIEADGDLVSGLWIVSESQRAYPHNELAAHIIGSVNLDSEGQEGVELWQDEKLRGKIVSMAAVRDALGRPAFIDSSAARAAQEGKDGEPVSLTIDASLQFSVEEELRNSVRKANAKGGSVIVMNAMNGEILAMANEPSFNPNQKGVSQDRRRNRALTDGYEPGSTMKPILLASALSKGMKLSDQIHGEHGKIKIQGRTISEAEAHEKFEWMTLKKIIQVSSNVGSAKLAIKVGADHYANTLKSMGFGSKTGLGFPGEISGRVPPRKTWQPISLANIGFGHGVLVTPIQMARAYATILNGGWLVQPSLIKTTGKQNEAPKRVLSEKVTAQVIEALESTTLTKEGGTGGNAVLAGYRVGGKTGTAQKVDPDTGAYSRSKYVASFIGFPLGVEPKIVVFTSIDEPNGVYYGSQVAAPLFREVLNAVATRYSLPTPAGTTLASSAHKKAPVSEARGTKDVVSSSQAKAIPADAAAAKPVSLAPIAKLEAIDSDSEATPVWKMPSLRGLTPREAIQALQGHSLNLEIRGSGLVRYQLPEEGATLSEGSTVRLTMDDGE